LAIPALEFFDRERAEGVRYPGVAFPIAQALLASVPPQRRAGAKRHRRWNEARGRTLVAEGE